MTVITSFLRWFLHHLYHDLAWGYDLVAWLVSFGAWTDWVHSALQYVEGASILELGPGTGHLQRALFDDGHAPFGLDESQQMVRRVRNRIDGHGHQPALVRGLAQHLPFRDESFDSIVCTFPTDYILDPRVHEAIWRTLKPGGMLVVIPWAIRFETQWLFEVTHQGPSRGAAGLSVVLDRMGFEVETRLEHRPHGVVAMILARKPAQL